MQSVVTFDLCVAVVDDGKEHVEQYEEDEEHIQEEVDGSEDVVSVLQGIEIEISQDDTEQSETTMEENKLNSMNSSSEQIWFKLIYLAEG